MPTSDRQFRALAENLPTLCWIAGPDGYIHWYNRRWYEYTGTSAAEMEGWGWQSVHHPEKLPDVLERWRASIASGQPFEMLFPLRGGDGVYRPFLTRVSPSRDADGAITAWFGVNTDLTDQMNAEQALRDSEAKFRTLAQAIPNHVWTALPDGQLDWFNDQVYQYSGAAPGELDGQSWAAIVHPDDVAAIANGWAASLASGASYQAEFRLRRADGLYRWHVSRAVPIRDADGRITRWIGTNTDIEDQKSTAEALAHLNDTLEHRVESRTAELLQAQETLRQSQRMESLGKLTGGVAHDFNNLLQVISGNLQLLLRDIAGNAKAERRVHNAMAGVTRGAKLASQLLSFGRRQPLAPRVVNIGRFIRETDDMLRRALGDEIEIETVVAGGLWNTQIDPGNIENAILNLAINARDAMDGVGKLTIEAGNASLDDDYTRLNPDATPGQYVLLAITDTGCGIAPEIVDEVFEPFFTTKADGKGSGLGLSMVYGFVKQSGGHIKIYSEVGQGTTIKLYLPRTTESEDVVVPAVAGPVEGGSESILVVEDDAEVRETSVATLLDLGYRVLQAKDAQSALSVVESGSAIDLLFTDVVMPGPLRSPELARKARERLPGLVVLFTSGYTENAIVHGGRLDPGVDLLPKPYSREALAQKIRAVLAKRN
ncbi:PAS domain-containing protein [Rhodopseudomonas sp. BAL398]|uniref:PAS domain-containing protein n=1 Tax=Rhodopseudomonas sp. BAL398 TaxID=3034676 RepID=UPI00294B9902|nr:PAS domain-containing protein [Rhodopseudomonas sp. BAL398]WOK16504.1 PAS domain-containing protein [Rhodopseudomonas sp. BAL398]